MENAAEKKEKINTVLQVDDLVVGPQSDHLVFGRQESIDPLTVTLTPSEVNGNGQTR